MQQHTKRKFIVGVASLVASTRVGLVTPARAGPVTSGAARWLGQALGRAASEVTVEAGAQAFKAVVARAVDEAKNSGFTTKTVGAWHVREENRDEGTPDVVGTALCKEGISIATPPRDKCSGCSVLTHDEAQVLAAVVDERNDVMIALDLCDTPRTRLGLALPKSVPDDPYRTCPDQAGDFRVVVTTVGGYEIIIRRNVRNKNFAAVKITNPTKRPRLLCWTEKLPVSDASMGSCNASWSCRM